MDKMCNKSEVEDLNESKIDDEVLDKVKRCASPVFFNYVNPTKAARGNNFDSSDSDIPCHQVNQSIKSKTSSKYGDVTSESVVAFSPTFSPILLASTAKFQPPTIDRLNTLSTKDSDRSWNSSLNCLLPNNKDNTKPCGIFESLGLNDKDISWVSSMGSPPPKQVPSSKFNTIEKATFFPEEKFKNIQPRALFSPNTDQNCDDFDCHPISFCSESDDEPYKSNIRLSDVCATLGQLKVKSLDQASDHSVDSLILKEDYQISPVIKTKKKKLEGVKKSKKSQLVLSPNNEHKCLLSVKENVTEEKSDDRSNFLEDDSFQSMCFTCIDKLCKTMGAEGSSSSLVFKSGDCDKTLTNSITDNTEQVAFPKIFYDTKSVTDVYEVSSTNNMYSCAEALEEGNRYISVDRKIDKSVAKKGIVQFDVLNKNAAKMDAVKRTHSEVTEEKDICTEKKFKKENDENTGWEMMKPFMSESQLNVSDGEIFRTVENLEKTLASQEKNDAEKLNEAESSLSQSSVVSVTSKANSGKVEEEPFEVTPEFGGGLETSKLNVQSSKHGPPTTIFMGFTNALGLKITVSEEALSKGRELLRDCEKELESHELRDAFDQVIQNSNESLKNKQPKGCPDNSLLAKQSESTAQEKATVERGTFERGKSVQEELMSGFLTGSGKSIQVSAKALDKAKALMLECDEGSRKEAEESSTVFKGFSTGLGKKIQVSAKALERAKSFLADCDENLREKLEIPWTKGFTTISGKKIHVSAKALENAKALIRECDEGLKHEEMTATFAKGFSTVSGKKVQVSAKALEKAKTLLADVDENFKSDHIFVSGFATSSVFHDTLEKARSLLPNQEREFSGSAQEWEEQTSSFHSREGTEPKDGKLQTSVEEQENSTVGLSAALDSKLEKVESSVCKSGECETAKSKNFNAETLASVEGSKTVGSAVAITAKDCNTESVKSLKNRSETAISKLQDMDNWEEIIPSWLQVYFTSPSLASDRAELNPIVAHEDGRISKSERDYIVKSPVLGSSDRFYGKRKRRKLHFEGERKLEQKTHTGFSVPFKDSSKKASEKRTSNLVIDFSVPFKKVKVVEEVASEDCNVRVERARRREEQENSIKEKHRVKPSKGLHLSKKLSEKQTSWVKAVDGLTPEVHSEEVLKKYGVIEDVLQVKIENAGSFTFKKDHFFGPNCEQNINGISVGDGCVLILDDEHKCGVREFKMAFLASSGVQPSLVPDGWVENHYKWIVWKLAHYERSFPQYFAGCLNPDNVMLQLRYRYDREIDRAERSALKKILERDDTSAKRLVLCVCGIDKIAINGEMRYELNLTDGWYSCRARPDPAMARILTEGKVLVGTKLVTQGAVLVNCDQGVSPLEVTGDVYLKISTNSTRRVRWDTKLGFQKNPQNFPISLSSILPQGGLISRIDVIIVRVYPVLYMEKTGGHHVIRNRRSEEKVDAEYRRIQEQKMETVCNEVRLEMRNSVNCDKLGVNFDKYCERVEEMCQVVKSCSDPSALQDITTAYQRKLSENFDPDRFTREWSEKIEKKLKDENFFKRNVSEFFRAKIVDLRKPDYNNPAVLSVWHPNEDLVAMLSEGKVFSLMNVALNNSSRVCRPLQINTTRQTQYRAIVRNVKYPARKLTLLKDVFSKVSPVFEEVDVVGMVVVIQDISYGSRLSQVVYLTDLGMNFVGIVFWGNCKNYGWENVIKIRHIVACTNLQWKKNHHSRYVPSLYVSESSVFTENPKHEYMKEGMEKLKQNLPQDVDDFVSKCEETLLAKLEESKWLAHTSVKDPSKCLIPNGFESRPTASSTPIKPFGVRLNSDETEPSPIQKRIEKLQAYGEPPSLIPLFTRKMNTGGATSRKSHS